MFNFLFIFSRFHNIRCGAQHSRKCPSFSRTTQCLHWQPLGAHQWQCHANFTKRNSTPTSKWLVFAQCQIVKSYVAAATDSQRIPAFPAGGNGREATAVTAIAEACHETDETRTEGNRYVGGCVGWVFLGNSSMFSLN